MSVSEVAGQFRRYLKMQMPTPPQWFDDLVDFSICGLLKPQVNEGKVGAKAKQRRVV